MAKYAQKTKLIVNGRDVTSQVLDAALPRIPGEVEMVVVTLAVSALTVSPDGTLVIEVDAPEEV